VNKYPDPYATPPWERVIDEFVGFWGALLGVESILERPLHSTSGRDTTSADYSTRSVSADAWRRERNYRRARAHLIANDLNKVPGDITNTALKIFSRDRYIDWLLKVDATLGGRRPIDLILIGDYRPVMELLRRNSQQGKRNPSTS